MPDESLGGGRAGGTTTSRRRGAERSSAEQRGSERSGAERSSPAGSLPCQRGGGGLRSASDQPPASPLLAQRCIHCSQPALACKDYSIFLKIFF